jgi:hypothetical protein
MNYFLVRSYCTIRFIGEARAESLVLVLFKRDNEQDDSKQVARHPLKTNGISVLRPPLSMQAGRPYSERVRLKAGIN